MKRDQLIGLWVSKPLFDHIQKQATETGITRPEFIRQILLNEYLTTQADQLGLSVDQYINQLVEQGQLAELTSKKLEAFISSVGKEASHGRQQQHGS
ncbi:MAG: hypothetical protein G8D88_13850 [gamma proteobacterium symbiont of Ctena orbiculata]